jgi:hypothetical protein
VAEETDKEKEFESQAQNSGCVMCTCTSPDTILEGKYLTTCELVSLIRCPAMNRTRAVYSLCCAHGLSSLRNSVDASHVKRKRDIDAVRYLVEPQE